MGAAWRLIVSVAVVAVTGLLAGVAAGAGPARTAPYSTPTSTPTSTAPYSTPTTTAPYSTPTTTTAPPVIAPGLAGNAFRTRGMWIWILGSSSGGDLSSVIAESRAAGIKTLMIKSSDGVAMWSQFNSTLVSTLHAAGLRVCAWQFVYGTHPILEARAGAEAVKDGADCLVIDAEGQYSGKYVQAQTYVHTLRTLVGANFPLALAGFPFVDYHPGFPYSVFLGPGGAQDNTPQMYWKDIGTSVAAVFAHTYAFNELYRRPIAPLGQLYDSPPLSQIRRFRSISRYYGAAGISWWDWQSASTADFRALAQPAGAIRGFVADTTVASLGRGAAGDLVVWAQEHLVSAGEPITIDGRFGFDTEYAVESFQLAHDLPETGVLDPNTWARLLRYPPVTVKWVRKKKRLSATVARGGAEVLPVPRSASLPARRDEIAAAGARGRPQRP